MGAPPGFLRAADPPPPDADLRARWILVPPGTGPEIRLLLGVRALRAFGDGFVSLLLPYHFVALGFSAFEIGVIATATLLGTGLSTLVVGLIAHRFSHRTLLSAGCVLMTITGGALVLFTGFWPLLVVAFIGTLSLGGWDLSIFLPLEQTLLAGATGERHRTAVFARYGLLGGGVAALGSLAAGLPELAAEAFDVGLATAVQLMFAAYGAFGLVSLVAYRRIPTGTAPRPAEQTRSLGPSRRRIYTLGAIFSLDAFGGGFIIQSLLALWLLRRFELSPAVAGTVFFWLNIVGALSQLAASRIARRIGPVNTMVYTHLPANFLLLAVPFMPSLDLAVALLLIRATLSQIDVPTRAAYVMAAVTPEERPAAVSLTTVPRGFASAISPLFAGYLLGLSSFGWPLMIGATVKIVYDGLLLAWYRGLRASGGRG